MHFLRIAQRQIIRTLLAHIVQVEIFRSRVFFQTNDSAISGE